MPKVLLDPGHGKGYNHSGVNPDYTEGTRMWDLSVILKRKLEEKGFEVFTTRPSLDDDPSHYERGTLAGKLGADLFLSLHSNAPSRLPDGSHDASKTGTVGCYSQTDIAWNRPLTEKLTLAVSELMQNPDLGSFCKDYPNRPGVDYYAVLRFAAAAGCRRAIIIEHGFHTNKKDSDFLMKDKNLELLANAEAAVIREYFDSWGKQEKVKYYRVQVGAYTVKENALRKEEKLKEKGFDCFIVYSPDDGYYRVQVGAYEQLENAEKKAEKLLASGFTSYIFYGE